MKALLLFPVLTGWFVVSLGLHVLTSVASPPTEDGGLPQGQVAYSVMTDSALIHGGPSDSSPVIGELRKPTVVMTVDVDQGGAWHHVFGAGWDGWIRASDVSAPYLVGPMTAAHLEPPRSS